MGGDGLDRAGGRGGVGQIDPAEFQHPVGDGMAGRVVDDRDLRSVGKGGLDDGASQRPVPARHRDHPFRHGVLLCRGGLSR